MMIARIAGFALCLVMASGGGLGTPLRSCEAAPAGAVIYGRVLSSPGAASRQMPPPLGVAGVTVTLAAAATRKVISSAITGSDGSFRFEVEPGDYAVAGRGNPHLGHVDAGEQREVNLYLPNP